MKGIKIAAIAGVALVSFYSGAHAESWIKQIKVDSRPVPMTVDGKLVTPKDGKTATKNAKSPKTDFSLLYNGIYYVPLETVLDLAKVSYKWDSKLKGYAITSKPGTIGSNNAGVKVTASSFNLQIDGKLISPQDGIYVNGKERNPFSLQVGGATYMPIEYILTNSGYQFDYDAKTRTIVAKSPANLAQGGTKELMSFTKFETKNIIWKFTDKGLGYKYIYEDGENLLKDEESYFGQPLKDKVESYIYGNEGFLGGYRQASYNGDSDTFRINGDDLGGSRNQDIRYHFVHEMAHAYTNHKWGMRALSTAMDGRSLWLVEGMAEYVAKQKVTYSPMTLPNNPRLKDLGYGKDTYTKQLLELAGRNHFDFGSVKLFMDTDSFGDYMSYESIVYYLETELGHDKFFAYVDLLAAGTNTEQAFQKVYGKSEAELVKDWKAYFGLK